jgi:hypothetical protein
MLYAAEVGYIESVVRILPIHSMFGLTTNFALPLAGAEYCHPANFSSSIPNHIRYAAHRRELP